MCREVAIKDQQETRCDDLIGRWSLDVMTNAWRSFGSCVPVISLQTLFITVVEPDEPQGNDKTCVLPCQAAHRCFAQNWSGLRRAEEPSQRSWGRSLSVALLFDLADVHSPVQPWSAHVLNCAQVPQTPPSRERRTDLLEWWYQLPHSDCGTRSGAS
jgi:hypothetical protein